MIWSIKRGRRKCFFKNDVHYRHYVHFVNAFNCLDGVVISMFLHNVLPSAEVTVKFVAKKLDLIFVTTPEIPFRVHIVMIVQIKNKSLKYS